MQIKPNEIRDTFANVGNGLAQAMSAYPDVTNPNYRIIGHPDFHKKLNPGDVGYVPFSGKFPEADSIRSLEDWNKLCHSARLEVFEKKFPDAYAKMSEMYRKYREKLVAESIQYYDNADWSGSMMQKYVEEHLPVKIYPPLTASKVEEIGKLLQVNRNR